MNILELLENRQFIYANALLDTLCVPPTMFVQIINECGIAYYVESYGNEIGDEVNPKDHPFDASHFTDQVKFHTYHIRQAIKRCKMLQDLIQKDGSILHNDDMVHSLQEELNFIRLENAELRAIIQSEQDKSNKPSKTGPATNAASTNRVEEWKGYAAQMVMVALDCEQEGPKPRKRPQLQTIAKRHGGNFPQVALEVLWRALPDKHKSKEPGPQRQD